MRRPLLPALLGLLTAGAILTHFAVQTHATRRMVAAVPQCLAGPAAADPALRRLLPRIAAAEEASPGSSWPRRCLPHLEALASSRAVPPSLSSAARQVADLLGAPQPSSTAAAIAQALPDLATLLPEALAFAQGSEAAGVALPAVPVDLLLEDDRAQSIARRCAGYQAIDAYRLDPQPLDRVGFRVDPAHEQAAPGPHRFCQLGEGPDGPLSSVSCAPLDLALARADLIASTTRHPFLLSTLDGVFTPDNQRVASPPPGRATPERLFLVASREPTPGQIKLFDPLFDPVSSGARWLSGAKRAEATTPTIPLLAAGHLLWIEEDTLMARKLLDEEPGFGPTQRLGPASPSQLAGLRACRTAAGWLLAVPQPPGPEGDAIDLYFPAPATFSPPRRLTRRGSALGPWLLACVEGEARIGWTRGDARVSLHQARCTADACRESSAEATLPPQASPLLLPQGDTATLLWQSGPFVWSRSGPLLTLASAPPRALVQAPSGGGLSLAEAELFGRGDVFIGIFPVRGARQQFVPLRFGAGVLALDCPLR